MMKEVNKTKSLSSDSIEKPMLSKILEYSEDNRSFGDKFKQKVLKSVQMCNRMIRFNGQVLPQNYQSNLVKNTKYNLLTFIPLVLFNQFKFFINLFFLTTALSQLIDVLRVGLFITFMGPLIMVIGLTMGKEAYDDFRTYRSDIEANSKKYGVIDKNRIVQVKSKDIKLGDIVQLKGGDRIPADMVVLHTSDQQGTLFIKTDQLDGETDWKLRKAVKITQMMVRERGDLHLLRSADYHIELKAPESNIYHFDGLFVSPDGKEKLTLENTVWTSTVLTNGTAIGLVVYIGGQTRIALGASTPRTKVGILDLEINLLSKILFGILFLLTLILLILQGMEIRYAPIQFMRIFILLSSIIPISMRVNLDFAKLFHAYNINKDLTIEGTIARNTNTPEELGRVKYVLSDKTGTLTQNEMVFKRISIEDNIKFTDEQADQIKEMMEDYEGIRGNLYCKERFVKDILTSLILCHNVTPVYDEDRTKSFQASSPDEITFVKTAESFGLTLEERTQTSIKIRIPSGKQVKYDILNTFPFSSDTKRMGIILRECETQEIVFYLKGADTVMKHFIQSRQKKGFIDEECKDLSSTGLRTLVLARKKLTKEQYQNWVQTYDDANNRLQIDKNQINKIMNNLQNGVDFLGVTGIQDKLQRDLKQVIESLRNANIKIWMITGDKVQTAQCISISCGLQKVTQTNVKIQEADMPMVWRAKWQSAKLNKSRVLIIDGKTLTMVLNSKEYREDFFLNAMEMPAVICCRCSPEQKRLLTAGVKQFRKDKEAVLGIGDGGNDVGMIQAADVGVGIEGKQGKQAALAADFSIQEFRNLKTLLLWHGRLSYNRSALLASFIIHRGFIVSVIQTLFIAMFFFVSIPVFNSYLNLGYATLFTFWPVFSLVLDTDITRQVAMDYPRLYASLQSEKKLQWTAFMVWIWKASFQGSIIIILTIALFAESSYLRIQTLCFTILILTEYCMTMSEIRRIHIATIMCVAGSIISYVLCIILFPTYVQISSFTMGNLFFVFLITACSYGPILVAKLIRKVVAPTDYEKVMKNVKRRLVGMQLIGDTDEKLVRTEEGMHSEMT